MDRKRTCMLFLPPQPPVPLPESGTLVVGRSKTCDLSLGSPDASRRHADITAEDAAYVLRDLGSTNGTLVNGQRVEEHSLRTGDRIDIGGELITFCEVDPALDGVDGAADGAKTRIMERPALGECIRGNLAEIPTFAVLQMLEMGRKAGLLEMDGGDVGLAKLWLVDGRPVHAETKSQRGFDAAVAIVNAATGRFSFEPGRAAPERTIEASATELLLEASRILDEQL